jgi:hypothetical protein
MKKEELETLINLRQQLVATFSKLKDYKSNKNAIMREVDHAKIVHEVVVELDKVLKNHVSFSDKN